MILYEFESGSRLTGTHVPGSDRDRIAIYAEAPGHVTGVWGGQGSVQTADEQGDATWHPLRRFAQLAAEGNPNLLQGLFVPRESIIRDTPHGRAIRSSRGMFVSRQAGSRFLGFAVSQRQKLVGESNNRTNRPDLVAKYGFDTKFAGHAYRLAAQGAEFMSTGRLNLPMRDPWRRTIVAIRRGEYTFDQALGLINEQIALLTASQSVSDLPARADYIGINELLHEIHVEVWGEMGDPYAGIPRLS